MQQSDEESEEDDEPEPTSSKEKAAEANLPVRGKPGQATVEDDDGDDGSFQEVKL